MMIKGLLHNFETIDMADINTVLDFIHAAIHSHTQVVYAFDKEFYEDFFDVMSRILGKAHDEDLLSQQALAT